MDFRPILTPLVPKAGEDLRIQPVFDELKELRREDDHDVSYGIWRYELKTPNWDRLEQLSYDLLTQKTKDLEILFWYIECLIKRYKVNGVLEGLGLLLQFMQDFWGDFFPLDAEYRGALLEAFDRHLSEHLLRLNLCGSPDYEVTLLQWRMAQHVQNLVARNVASESELLEEYGVNLEIMRNRLGLNVVEFVNNIRAEFSVIEKKVKEIVVFCDEKIPEVGFGFFETLKILQEINYILNKEMKINIKQEESPVVEDEKGIQSTALDAHNDSVASTSNPAIPIKSRDDAYAALEELTHFLKGIEPHSPVPALLEKLVLWKNLPLTEIIAHVKNEPEQYQLLYTMVGR